MDIETCSIGSQENKKTRIAIGKILSSSLFQPTKLNYVTDDEIVTVRLSSLLANTAAAPL